MSVQKLGTGKRRRFLIAVGCAEPGAQSRLRRLPGVAADLARMRSVFGQQLGFELVTFKGAGDTWNLDLSAREIEQGLQTFCRETSLSADDSLVFYYSGHGTNHGAAHYLCTRGFDPDQVSTGLETRRLAGLLPQSARRLWIILDVCRAGDGAASLCEAIARDRDLYKGSVWFLAACGQTTALDQAFSKAFAASAERFITRGGCSSQAQLVRSVQKGLGGERAPQCLVPSFYGADSFDFFGETWHSTLVHNLVRPLAPSLGKLGLRKLGDWTRASERARRSAEESGSAAQRKGELSAKRGRRPTASAGSKRVRWSAGGIATILLGLLAAAWLGSDGRTFSVTAERARGERPSGAHAGAPVHPTRVWFPGGTAPAVSTQDARATHARCFALALCAAPFAASPLADEVFERPPALGPFWLSRREVTNGELASFLESRRTTLTRTQVADEELALADPGGRVWARIARQRASAALPLSLSETGAIVVADPTRANEPASHVTWFGADAYCAALGGRLPSEAEWALAARGAGRTYPWGEGEPRNCQSVAFGRDGSGECESLGPRPMAVGSAAQDISAEGVNDLGGNVSEWTSTIFMARPGARARAGCDDAQLRGQRCRVVRGGSYWDARLFLRGAARSALADDMFWRALGFRCAFAAH